MKKTLLLPALLFVAGLMMTPVSSAKPICVAILPPGITSPFHSQIAKGAQEEGENLGFRVEVQATESEKDFGGRVFHGRSDSVPGAICDVSRF